MERRNFILQTWWVAAFLVSMAAGGNALKKALFPSQDQEHQPHNEQEELQQAVDSISSKAEKLWLSTKEIAQMVLDAGMTGLFFWNVIPSFIAGDTQWAIWTTKRAIPGYIAWSLWLWKKESIIWWINHETWEHEHGYLDEIKSAREWVAMMCLIVNLVEFVNINFDAMLETYINQIPTNKTAEEIAWLQPEAQLEYKISSLNSKIQYLAVFMQLFGPLTALGQSTILKSTIKNLVSKVQDMSIEYWSVSEWDSQKLMAQYEWKLMTLFNANQWTAGNLWPVVFALSKGPEHVANLWLWMLRVLPTKLVGMQNELNIVYNNIRKNAWFQEKSLKELVVEDGKEFPNTITNTFWQVFWSTWIFRNITHNTDISLTNNEVVGKRALWSQLQHLEKNKDTLDQYISKVWESIWITKKKWIIDGPTPFQSTPWELTFSYPELAYILTWVRDKNETGSSIHKQILVLINDNQGWFLRLTHALAHDENYKILYKFLKHTIQEADYTSFKMDKMNDSDHSFYAQQIIDQYYLNSNKITLTNEGWNEMIFDYIHLFDDEWWIMWSPKYLTKTLFDAFTMCQRIQSINSNVYTWLIEKIKVSLSRSWIDTRKKQILDVVNSEKYSSNQFIKFITEEIFTSETDNTESQQPSDSVQQTQSLWSKVNDNTVFSKAKKVDTRYQWVRNNAIHFLEHNLGKNSWEIVTMVGVIQAPYIYPVVESLSKLILQLSKITPGSAIEEIIKFVGYATSVTADNYVAEIVMYNLCKKLLPSVTDEQFMIDFAPIPAISGGMAFTWNPAHAIVSSYKKLYGAANDYTTDLFDEQSAEKSKETIAMTTVAEWLFDSVTLSQAIKDPVSMWGLSSAAANIMRPQVFSRRKLFRTLTAKSH